MDIFTLDGKLRVPPAMPTITNWHDALDGAQVDAAVGIAHAELAGDCDFRLHVTELKPGAKVKAHVHHRGNELYIIQSGCGKLYTGSLNDDGAVNYDLPRTAIAGDSFVIRPGTVHQLHNTGSDPLVLIFGCPDNHLSNDRQVVADYYPTGRLST